MSKSIPDRFKRQYVYDTPSANQDIFAVQLYRSQPKLSLESRNMANFQLTHEIQDNI